jgi:hypothetical protein
MKKAFLVLCIFAFIIALACSNPSGGSNGGSPSESSGTISATETDTSGTTTLSGGPYSIYAKEAASTAFWAQSTSGTVSSTSVWELIYPNATVTAPGSYSFSPGSLQLSYTTSSGAQYLVTAGTLVVTGYPSGTGGTLAGTFTGSGYYIARSTELAVTFSNGTFSLQE